MAPSKTDRPRFTIVAEKLLRVLQAVTPLASKDKDRPHLTQLRLEVRWNADADPELEVSACDGASLGKVVVPATSITQEEPIVFCVQTTHVPTLVKMLSRIDQKRRAELDVVIDVGRHKMRMQVAESEVFVPRNEEQLDMFPPLEKVIPARRRRGDVVAERFGMSPDLMGKIMRAASHVASSVMWNAPESPLHPIRLDVVEAIGVGIKATFVVMPQRVGVEEPKHEPESQNESLDL